MLHELTDGCLLACLLAELTEWLHVSYVDGWRRARNDATAMKIEVRAYACCSRALECKLLYAREAVTASRWPS